MPMDHWVSLFSAVISFIGLLLVVVQLRNNTRQQELASLVEIYDINRQLLSLAFSHPQLFAILDDNAKDADPVWEKHYLQLWFNQFALIHSYLKRSVLGGELKESLVRDLSDFMVQDNMQRHWQRFSRAYPESFQVLINGILKNEPPVAAYVTGRSKKTVRRPKPDGRSSQT